MQTPLPVPIAPPPFTRNWNPRRVFLASLAVISVVAGFYLMYRFSNVLFVLFIAVVLATAMRPAVQWLEKRHVPQWGGVLLIYLAVVLITAGVFATLVPLVADQGSRIVRDVPDYYGQVRSELQESGSEILRRVGRNLPEQISVNLLGETTRQEAAATGDEESVASQAVGYLRSFGWGLFGFIAVFLIAYFWTLDRDQIMRAGLLIVPLDSRPAAQELWDSAEQQVGAYIRGQALLMLAIGVLSAIVFFAIGLPSALLLAVFAGILEAIPYIGPFLTAAMAILITLAEAPDKVWWVIAACIAIQEVENWFLVPRVMSRTVGVNPLVTLLAIAAFGSLLGMLGVILAIPLAVVIRVLLDHWVLRRDAQSMGVIEGRDKAAVVRYQAQDLAQDLRERIRAKPGDHDDDDSFEERIEALVAEIDELLVQVATPAPPQTVSAPQGGIS